MSRRLAEGISGAPSGHETPAVEAVVAVGANLGDRADTVRAALEDLAGLPLTEVIAAADPVETVALTPDGRDPSAPGYLNTVVRLRTRLAPSVLLGFLHAIEERHGRPPRTPGEARWQDRTLDLDLIVHGDVRSDGPGLQVPHPRAAERDFVLEPWSQIDPDAAIPGVGRVSDLLARLRADHQVNLRAAPSEPGS